MPLTVIALFSDAAEAREAEAALLRSGFTDDDVGVASSSSSTPAEGGSPQEGTIRRFFRELLGQEGEIEGYAAAAEARETVVTVHAETAAEAARASQILDEAGALDVDEKPSVADPVDVEELPAPGGRVGERSRGG